MAYDIKITTDNANKEVQKLTTSMNRLAKSANTKMEVKAATKSVDALKASVDSALASVKTFKAAVRASIQIKVNSAQVLTAINRMRTLETLSGSTKSASSSAKMKVDSTAAMAAVTALSTKITQTIALAKTPIKMNVGTSSEMQALTATMAGLSHQLTTLAANYQKATTAAASKARASDKVKEASKKEADEVKKAAKASKDKAAADKKARGASVANAESLVDATQAAAMFRAGLLASGQSMGLFTAHTLVAAAATYAFVKAIGATVSAGALLSQSMQRVYAVTGILGERTGDVTDKMKAMAFAVRDVAKGTIFTANEVAAGAVEFAMAGFTAEDSASALSATASLAAIGMTDMATAARTAANILNAFGMEATSLQRVVDRMAVAVTDSMMDIKQLAQSLSYVGPLAAATNTSFKDTVIILELMHDAGIKATKAGTALRRGMVNLLNPTKKQQDVIDALNISTRDGSGEMRSMLGISKQLAEKGIKPAQISILFGARAVAAWTQVIAEANRKMVKFEDAQKSVAGTSLMLRKQLEQNLINQFQIFKSAVEELQHILFAEFGPALVDLVKKAKSWVDSLQDSRVELIALGQATGVLIASVILITSLTALATSALAKEVLTVGALTVAKNALTASTVRLTAATGVWAKAMVLARGALLAISAHPLIAAAAAAAAAFFYFKQSIDDVSESQRALKTSAEEATLELQKQVNMAFAPRETALEGKIAQIKRQIQAIEGFGADTKRKMSAGGGSAVERNIFKNQKAAGIEQPAVKLLSPEQEAKVKSLNAALADELSARRSLNVEKMKSLGIYAGSKEALEDEAAASLASKQAFEAHRKSLQEKGKVDASEDPKEALKGYKLEIARAQRELSDSLSNINFSEQIGDISEFESIEASIGRVKKTQDSLNESYNLQRKELERARDKAKDLRDTLQLSSGVGPDTLDRRQKEYEGANEALIKLTETHEKETQGLKAKGVELQRNLQLAQGYSFEGGRLSTVAAKPTVKEGLSFTEGLRDEGRTGADALAEDHAKQLELLGVLHEKEKALAIWSNEDMLAVEQQFQDAKLQLAIANSKKQDALWGGHHQKVFDFGEAARKKDKAGMLSSGIAMLDIGAKQSKKVFKLQKGLAIAQAIISTQKGIAEAWGYGPILGPAMAALVALNGFAAVKAIRAQEFSGGGSGSFSSAGGGGASLAAPAPAAPVDQGGRGVTIYIEGNMYANEDFRRTLVETLELAQSNDEIRIF